MSAAVRSSLLLSSLMVVACGGGWGGGSDWVKQPLVPEDERASMQTGSMGGSKGQPEHRVIGGSGGEKAGAKEGGVLDRTGGGGKVLGTFRNTYYDFPSEAEPVVAGTGAPASTAPPSATVPLMSASCQPIAKVSRAFYDAVCVQGSGSLAKGGVVSFAKRDCACAEICPRTNQKICFDALDKTQFPWGRGASGGPITPFRSVAADTNVLPMGTALYIPDFDGITVGAEQRSIDGCFVVEDRGLRVQGEHVDIFAGQPSQTAALNSQVPSNQGVTVVVNAPKCAYLTKH